jgi:hypothetical protein
MADPTRDVRRRRSFALREVSIGLLLATRQNAGTVGELGRCHSALVVLR